jgi:hypothetical protein
MTSSRLVASRTSRLTPAARHFLVKKIDAPGRFAQ